MLNKLRMKSCPVIDEFAEKYLIANTDLSLVCWSTCHASIFGNTCFPAHIPRILTGVKRGSFLEVHYFLEIPCSSGDILKIDGRKTQRLYDSLLGRVLLWSNVSLAWLWLLWMIKKLPGALENHPWALKSYKSPHFQSLNRKILNRGVSSSRLRLGSDTLEWHSMSWHHAFVPTPLRKAANLPLSPHLEGADTYCWYIKR